MLSENGRDLPNDWKIYYSEEWDKYCFTRDLLDQLQDNKYDGHFKHIDEFLNDARQGRLPSFSFIEPTWGLKKWHFGENGNDYHPPCDLSEGEGFLFSIFRALAHDLKYWTKTLLIINFDEHGGTYDHVPPPWHAPKPWGGTSPTPRPDAFEGGFQFDRYGVRVPLILVSPYIQPRTVFRAEEGQNPFDHASVIATILTMMDVPKQGWKLGNRVDAAPTFHHVLNLGAPREDVPELSREPCRSPGPAKDPPYNDLQLEIAHRIVAHAAAGNHDQRFLEYLHRKHFEPARTISELSTALADTLQALRARTLRPPGGCLSRLCHAVKRLFGGSRRDPHA